MAFPGKRLIVSAMRRAPSFSNPDSFGFRQVQRHKRGNTRTVRLMVGDDGGRHRIHEAECLGQELLVTRWAYARSSEGRIGRERCTPGHVRQAPSLCSPA